MTSAQIIQPVPPGGCSGGGSGTSPAIVQTVQLAGASGISSVVFANAPKQGNLLLAFATNTSDTPNTAGGWIVLQTVTTGTDYGLLMYKIAGASESATQELFTSNASPGASIVYEISNGGIGPFSVADATTNAPTVSLSATRLNALIVGAFARTDANLPTSITGATADGTSAAGSRSVAGFHHSVTVGTNTVLAAYAASVDMKTLAAIVY